MFFVLSVILTIVVSAALIVWLLSSTWGTLFLFAFVFVILGKIAYDLGKIEEGR